MALTFTEAAERILEQAGKPLHFREITQRATDQDLIEVEGQTPWNSMNGSLRRLIRREGGEALFVALGDGMFGLREWGLEGELTGGPAEPGAAEVSEAPRARPRREPTPVAERAPVIRERMAVSEIEWPAAEQRLSRIAAGQWLDAPFFMQVQSALSSMLVWGATNLLVGLALFLGRRSPLVRRLAGQLAFWGAANTALAITGLDGLVQQERLPEAERQGTGPVALQMLWARKFFFVLGSVGLLTTWLGSKQSRTGREGSRERGAGIGLLTQGVFWAVSALWNAYLIGRRISQD